MIDRYLIRYFLAVVDAGTFSRAAAISNVSQPTLSAGIAKLERSLGRKLFERSSRRVHLTAAGNRLLVHARQIENEFNSAQAAVQGLLPSTTFRLGLLSSISTSLVAAFVAAVRAESPTLQLELVEGNERTLLQYLGRGRIDAGICLDRDNHRFRTESLWEEGYVLALPKRHAQAHRDRVSAEELSSDMIIIRTHCEVLAETSRHFTKRGVRPFFPLKTGNDDRAMAMVREGLGITVVPETHALDGVVKPSMADFGLRRRISLFWREEGESHIESISKPIDMLRHEAAAQLSG